MLKRFLALLAALLLPGVVQADTLTVLPAPIEGAVLVSCSPDGSSELYAADDGLLIMREDGSTLPVKVNEARGAADAYGNLSKVAGQITRNIGSEGFVWSPDGRYAALVNQNAVVMRALFTFDPTVIDMQTGEMFLLAAYHSKLRDENAGTILTCTFSADSRYLYAVITGNVNNARFSLMQYDLTTLEATVLHTWEEHTYWPHLAQLADGSFLLLRDTNERNAFTGLMHIADTDGYAHTIADFTQRMIFFSPRSMQYSAASGHALILSNSYQGSNAYSNLLHLRPDESLSVQKDYWAVSSLKADHVAVLSKNELQSPSDVMIREMRLSPEGERALLLCCEGSNFALRMLNLADGTLTAVTGVDSDTLRGICTASAPYLAWFEDVIILGQTPANARAYRLN